MSAGMSPTVADGVRCIAEDGPYSINAASVAETSQRIDAHGAGVAQGVTGVSDCRLLSPPMSASC